MGIFAQSWSVSFGISPIVSFAFVLRGDLSISFEKIFPS